MPQRKLRIELARAYNPPPTSGSSFRVLVDGLWPRGVRKEDLHLDAWMKGLAPSNELRRWFNHDPRRWHRFRRRFFKELEAKPDQVAELLRVAGKQSVLLLYAARDEKHNNAVALKEFLEDQHANQET